MIFFKGENITAGYGGADIIKNCNIQVEEGEIVKDLVSSKFSSA